MVRLNAVNRGEQGFTLTEMLIVSATIGILAVIALPNYMAARQKAMVTAVRGNMRVVQVAAEAYGVDAGGIYSASVGADGIGPYFNNGGFYLKGDMGEYPTNPITGALNVAPVNAGPTNQAEVNELRTSAPSNSPAGIGGTTYKQVEDGLGYAVTGGDSKGLQVTGRANTVMVLSNF